MAEIWVSIGIINSIVMPYDIIELANIGSGNGLLLGSTKPLPEPVLTYDQLDPAPFT